jgi:eukaryotic-like serine/threonine-protein kinase
MNRSSVDAFGDTLGEPREDPPPASAVPRRAVLAGRYQILGLIGAGGMGNVYQARDLELGETLALKMLRPEIVASPGALERFRREVKLARRVTHPNVARVFDIGDDEGTKFLTMELVAGESLGALLGREGRLPIPRALSIVCSVCAGLTAAHGANVVHRDLKPDNVLLGHDGRVVITDFGLARAASSDEPSLGGAPGQRSIVQVSGTPAYMAPEQLDRTAVIDGRADVYALGAVLYEMLTGECPWKGENAFALAAARLLGPPPDPRARRPSLPTPLADAVARAMARHPEDRFQSASDFAAALAVVQGRPSEIPPRPHDASAARRKELAVLPFINVGAPDQDYLAVGLTEDLIDRLSLAEGLNVRSRGVVMKYSRMDREPRQIGRELGVDVVVEGTVRKEEGMPVIGVRVVSVADGVQIWAKRYKRAEAQLLAINESAAKAIADALVTPLAGSSRGTPSGSEVIDLYLRARATYHGFGADLSGESTELYRRALELAPDEPRILAGYAMARTRLWMTDDDPEDSAERAAQHAVRLAPELPETQVALATVRYQTGDEAGAVEALRAALRVARGSAEAHDLLGRILGETLRFDDARRHLEMAVALDPTMRLPRLALARVHLLRRVDDDADLELDAIDDDKRAPIEPLMARLIVWRDDVERARKLLLRVGGSTAGARLSRALLEMLLRGSAPYAAVSIAEDTSRLRVRLRAFLLQVEAECACFLGDRERAVAAIQRVGDNAFFDIAWLDACPLLASVQRDERVLAIRERAASRAQKVVREYLLPRA